MTKSGEPEEATGDVDWKEYQIHDGDDRPADVDEEEDYNTYATHNLFQSQEDENDEDYYEILEYRMKQQQEEQAPIEIRHHDETANSTGLGVWLGAEAMCAYLEEHPKIVSGKRILELGAGVGLCGLVAHRLGASRVIMTDGDSVVMRNMRHNVQRNLSENAADVARPIECKQLIWGTAHTQKFLETQTDQSAGHPFDLVMASDCVYMTQSLVPLWETITRLLAPCDGDTEETKHDRKFLYVNVSASQAPIEMVLETAKSFRFEGEEVAPNVYLFQKQSEEK